MSLGVTTMSSASSLQPFTLP